MVPGYQGTVPVVRGTTPGVYPRGYLVLLLLLLSVPKHGVPTVTPKNRQNMADAEDIDVPATKKSKLSTTHLTETTVFTFGVEDRHIQILGVHTLYNLVDFIVQNELEETADGHLWHVKVGTHTYKSSAKGVVISTLSLVVGTALFLEYDYGSLSSIASLKYHEKDQKGGH